MTQAPPPPARSSRRQTPVSGRMRLVAFLFVTGLVGAGAWLAAEGAGVEPLPPGSPIPEIPVFRRGDTTTLGHPAKGRLLLVVFDSRCPACRAELTMMEREVGKLDDVRIQLLSGELGLDVDSFARRWPALRRSPRVSWGLTPPEAVTSALGAWATPTNLVFDDDGRLIKKVVGASSLDSLLAEHGPSGSAGRGTRRATDEDGRATIRAP